MARFKTIMKFLADKGLLIEDPSFETNIFRYYSNTPTNKDFVRLEKKVNDLANLMGGYFEYTPEGYYFKKVIEIKQEPKKEGDGINAKNPK